MKINASNLVKLIKGNAPEILTALGISGVITTGYLAAQAGRKAQNRMEAEAPDLSLKEQTKIVWKFYIPAGVSGVVTIGCIVGATKGNAQRTAAAVTAYSITERAFSEYREKVVEQVGKGQEQKIRDSVVQRQIENNPPTREVIVIGGGEVLCCELYTNRYFRSDMESLRKAENDINHMVVNELYVTLDEFYYKLGLPPTQMSGDMGWDSDKLLELEFTTTLAESGEPCLAFRYNYVKPLKGL